MTRNPDGNEGPRPNDGLPLDSESVRMAPHAIVIGPAGDSPQARPKTPALSQSFSPWMRAPSWVTALRERGLRVWWMIPHPGAPSFRSEKSFYISKVWARSVLSPPDSKKPQGWLSQQALRAMLKILPLVQARLKFHRPVIWLYQPVPIELLRALRPTRLGLWITSEQSWNDYRSSWLPLVDAAHGVWVPRVSLAERIAAETSGARSKIHIATQPLDLQRWMGARTPKGDEPAELAGISYPRVMVWTGEDPDAFHAARFDAAAVVEAARARADLQWVVPVPRSLRTATLEAISQQPNIHLLDVAGERLVEVMKFCNVVACVGPGEVQPRMFEAMAAGKPVVVPKQAELSDYQRFVMSYATAPELLIQVERAIKEGVQHPDWCDELVQSQSSTAQVLAALRHLAG